MVEKDFTKGNRPRQREWEGDRLELSDATIINNFNLQGMGLYLSLDIRPIF